MGNFRNVQETNDREILFFEREKVCGQDENLKRLKEKKDEGHYEKVRKNITEFFYVTGDNPSGIKGALVVSKAEVEKNLKNKEIP